MRKDARRGRRSEDVHDHDEEEDSSVPELWSEQRSGLFAVPRAWRSSRSCASSSRLNVAALARAEPRASMAARTSVMAQLPAGRATAAPSVCSRCGSSGAFALAAARASLRALLEHAQTARTIDESAS
jgi:hypothetical protein